LQQINAGWQIMAVARVQPHSTSDMLMMARCLQRAVAAEKAPLAVAGGDIAALTKLTEPTLVVGIPHHCREMDQLQLEHVLCVVQPKRFTEIVQQNDISSIMDDCYSAVFSTAQQQTFVNSIATSSIDKLLMADVFVGPPGLDKTDMDRAQLLEMLQDLKLIAG
jgi:hypothetical protein